MTGEATTKPEKGGRLSTRGAVIVATVGIVVILGLAVFYVVVVAPLRQTHRVVREYSVIRLYFDDPPGLRPGDAISRLGGQERAASRLGLYLRLPDWAAPDKLGALALLSYCGKDAEPVLIEVIGGSNDALRHEAVCALARRGAETEEVVPALERLLGDEDKLVRQAAAEALKKIRGLKTSVKSGKETVQVYGEVYEIEWKNGKPWSGTLVLNPGMQDMEFEYFKNGKRVDGNGVPLDGEHYIWDLEQGKRVPKQFRNGVEMQE